jgi:hypothetical protein
MIRMQWRCFFFMLALGCLFDTTLRAGTLGKVQVIVTVDWEGRDLRADNITAFQKLRQEFPELPLVHYLNAAYFTKPDANGAVLKRTIDSVLRPGDQLGLHIHGWQSLIQAAGVKHRRTPNWVRIPYYSSMRDCSYDCGHEIPITAYTRDELGRIIDTSREILAQHGYRNLYHFRAGGWVTSPALSEALTEKRFISDSSAVPVSFLADEMQGMPLLAWLEKAWYGITPLAQPFDVINYYGSYREIPDNGALADYMSAEEMVDVVLGNLKARTGSENRIVVVGFHQETAAVYYDVMHSFLRSMQTLLQQYPEELLFATLPEKR